MLEPHRAALETCVYCPKLSRGACPVSNVEHTETVTPWGKMSLAYFAARGDVPVDAEHAAPAWACTGCYACRERCDHRNEVASALTDTRAEMFARGAAPAAAQQIAARFAARSAEVARAVDRLDDPRDPTAPALLIGCGYARHAPDVAADAVRAVNALSGRPHRLLRACCGLPLLHAGDRDGFLAAARRLVAEAGASPRLVVVDPGCARALLVEYPRLGVEAPPVDLFVDLAARALHRLAALALPPRRSAGTIPVSSAAGWAATTSRARSSPGSPGAPRSSSSARAARASAAEAAVSCQRRALRARGGSPTPASPSTAPSAAACSSRGARRACAASVAPVSPPRTSSPSSRAPSRDEHAPSRRAGAPREGEPQSRRGTLLAPISAPRRRTVAERLLGSYLLVLVAFAVTVGWSFQALRAAARDAELLRAGYAPLFQFLGEALAEQNVFDAQLNHITAAKNPSDVREWLDTARRARPFTFSLVRKAAERGLGGDADPAVRRFHDEIIREATAIEASLDNEPERFAKLVQALAVGDREGAERARNDLAKREAEAALRLRGMRTRVEEAMESLTVAARRREERSIELLVGLALVTLLVGVMTSLYARRVLAPLSVVTARANAVARGDLTPRLVVDTNDEIGELAITFESMVAAIQRARSELVQAERLATIGKMAAHVTHEIRNPLSAIGLNVELLEEEVSAVGDKEPMALIQAIKSEVDRLSRIAEQYLSVARRPQPRLEPERVDDLVRELCAFVRPELDRAGVALSVRADPDVPEIEIDEAQLRQALLNLIRNAREAMPKGGELTVEVLRAGDDPAGVEIRVDDTGAGVPEELRASIFDPFFTTKQRGTGLGLAVTREIVEAHHGTIACEPLAARGTRFRIALPGTDPEGA